MSANLSGFDAETVEPLDNSPVAPGWHKAIITDSGFENTQKPGNEKLSLKHQIVDGECEGRVIYGNINLVNANQKAVEIAERELSSVCRAAGIMKPVDSAELHDTEIMIKVGPRKDDPEKTEIKAWKSLQDYAATNTGSAPAAKKPAFNSKPNTPAANTSAAKPTSKSPGPDWANKK